MCDLYAHAVIANVSEKWSGVCLACMKLHQHYVLILILRLSCDFLFLFEQGSHPQKGDHGKSDTAQTVFGTGLHRKLLAAPIRQKAKKIG